MKNAFCSFCRTRQDRLFGMSAYPDSFAICGTCLASFHQEQPKPLKETCCFCGALDDAGFEVGDSEATICAGCLSRFLKESETPQASGQADDAIEEILIDWPVYFDAAMDLITVKVQLRDGTLWTANFTTPSRITWEMEKGKRTGEWASGTYFCHPDLIFVEELAESVIRTAIEDLWAQGRFHQAFRKT